MSKWVRIVLADIAGSLPGMAAGYLWFLSDYVPPEQLKGENVSVNMFSGLVLDMALFCGAAIGCLLGVALSTTLVYVLPRRKK